MSYWLNEKFERLPIIAEVTVVVVHQVEEILLTSEEAAGDYTSEEAAGDYLKSCIIVLYQLAFLWREERLGNAQFFSGLQPQQKFTQHSHLIMNEVQTYGFSFILPLPFLIYFFPFHSLSLSLSLCL